MQLFLMRHGIAADVGDGVPNDAGRPLTPEGQTKTREVAAGLLKCEVDFVVIATSPLLRAQQTAEIVRDVYRAAHERPRVETWPELEHADYDRVLRHILEGTADPILLVGHEPGLGRLASRLLTGEPLGAAIEFKKASVCALDVEFEDSHAIASLLWHATPRQLRLMGQ